MTNEELIKVGDIEGLYKHNTGYFYSLIKKYKNVSQEDVLSCCDIGFMKTVKNYTPDKGTKFLTYMSLIVNNEILMLIRNQRKYKNNISLNETINIDKEGNSLSLMDVIPDTCNIEEELMQKYDIQNLYEAISLLPNLQRTVIKFKLQKKKTQNNIADILNLSQSYIARLISKAIINLNKIMKARKSKMPTITNREKCYAYFSKNDNKTGKQNILGAVENFNVALRTAETYYYDWKKEYLKGNLKSVKNEAKVHKKPVETISEAKIPEKNVSEAPMPKTFHKVGEDDTSLYGTVAKSEPTHEPLVNESVPVLKPIKMEGAYKDYYLCKDGVGFNTDEDFITKGLINEMQEALSIWNRYYGKVAEG